MALRLSDADRAAWASALDLLENRGDRNSGPLDLACDLNPRMVRTPALELISAELERAIVTPGHRLMISMPPQEGKTSLIRHAVIRALQRNPDKRNVIASHALDLARTSGRAIRQMIDMFGTDAIDPATRRSLPDRLGISVAADHAAAADWELRGRPGGLYCVGVAGSLTGRPIDGVLFVDDPVKGLAEANSAVFQARSQDWWQAVSETRLAPEASVVIVMTRWSEIDLVGWLLGSDTADEWRVINIPALSDGVTDDALNRPVGQWMESARGRTVEHWEKIRKRVGERVFGSLYQGRPAPLEGGIFKREWFDRDRVRFRPEGPRAPVIVVDPADNTGTGDETGIGVASVDDHSRIYIGPDYSGHYTAARWARLALLACVRHEAAALAYERSLSGVRKIVQDAWSVLWKQARTLRRHHPNYWPDMTIEDTITAALIELVHADDPPDTVDEVRGQLIEMWPHVPALLGYPSTGPRVQIITPKTSKKLRAESVMSLYENRRVSHVGDMRIAEFQMATWNPGQPSPDRMDWVVHALSLLDGAQGVALGRSVERLPTTSTNLRALSTSRIARSTRR